MRDMKRMLQTDLQMDELTHRRAETGEKDFVFVYKLRLQITIVTIAPEHRANPVVLNNKISLN